MKHCKTLAALFALLVTNMTMNACAHTPDTSLPPATLETQAGVEGAQNEPALEVTPARVILYAATARAREDASREAARPAIEQAMATASAALDATDARIGAIWRSEPPAIDYLSVLKTWRSPSGTLSAGTTSRGYLLGAKELPFDGPHHTIIPRARPRKTRFGHPTMITLLEDAGEAVAREFPGSRIAIGNIAYEKGGDIRWSVSHNSGRDADIAFYVKDTTTRESIDAAPDLVTFREDGVSVGKGEFLFDVPRNWALVKALLVHDRARIQYIFISAGLKQMLLDHAKNMGEPEPLIAMASEALKQPTDSLPHNDHFHLRLACDLEDRLRGCIDRGPRWSWMDWHEEEVMARSLAMLPGLAHEDTEVRLSVLEYIEAIGSPIGPEIALLIAAYNDRPEVRERALAMARRFYTFNGAAIVGMQRLIRSGTLGDRDLARMYALLRRSLDPWTIDFVKSQLADASLLPKEKEWAARALSHQMEEELVPYLLDEIPRHPANVQHELALVLRRITNHSFEIDWEKATDESRGEALADWRAWWVENRGLGREYWVVVGMRRIGVEPEYALRYNSVDAMIAALPAAPDHLVYNINRSLRQITDRWAPLEQRDGKKLQDFWTKWWRQHRDRLLGAG